MGLVSEVSEDPLEASIALAKRITDNSGDAMGTLVNTLRAQKTEGIIFEQISATVDLDSETNIGDFYEKRSSVGDTKSTKKFQESMIFHSYLIMNIWTSGAECFR